MWLEKGGFGSGKVTLPSGLVLCISPAMTIHSVDCVHDMLTTGGCCDPCAALWISKPKSPFYRHVLYCLSQPNFSDMFAPSEKERADWRIYKAQVRQVDTSENNVVANDQAKAMQLLANRWTLFAQGEKTRVIEELRNGGRPDSKSKKGRRWEKNSESRSVSLLLSMQGGWSCVREVSNTVALPSRNTALQGVDKTMSTGLRANGCRLVGQHLSSYDITLSGDELALNKRIGHYYDNDTKKFVLVGNAGDAILSFDDYDSAPPPDSFKIASQALLFLCHTHAHRSPTVPVYALPTCGDMDVKGLLGIIQTIEVSVKLGTGGNPGVGNLAFDNAGPYLAIKQGVLKPFLLSEDVCVKDVVTKYGNIVCTPNDAWLDLAGKMHKPVSLIIARAHHLISKTPYAELYIPVPGLHAFTAKPSHTSQSTMCVSPEWPHSSRLYVKHYRDKHRKCVVWSLRQCAAPLSFIDMQLLYTSIPASQHGLLHTSIDQTDSTQNNDRSANANSFSVARGLYKHIFGAEGSAIHTFVGACYMQTFKNERLHLVSRVALAACVAHALVSQRLLVKLQSWNVQVHSYTSQTFKIMLLDSVAYMLLLVKACKIFSEKPLAPSTLGEWRNECWNAKLRCSSNAGAGGFTGDVSMLDVLKRLSLLSTVELQKCDLWEGNEKWGVNGCGKGGEGSVSGVRNDNGGVDGVGRVGAAGSVPTENVGQVTVDAIKTAAQVGMAVWKRIALAHGYACVFDKWSTFQKQLAELSKNDRDKEYAQYILKTPDELKESPDITYPDEQLSSMFPDLHEFFETASLLCSDFGVAELRDMCTVQDLDTRVQESTSCALQDDRMRHKRLVLPTGGVAHIDHFVSTIYNAGLGKQSRNLLDRFKYQSRLRDDHTMSQLGPLNGAASGSGDTNVIHDDWRCIEVHRTYAMLFDVVDKVRKNKKTTVVVTRRVFVGLVRALVTSKEGQKKKRFVTAVDRSDDKAAYMAWPHATVSIDGNGKVDLELYHDTPEWVKVTNGDVDDGDSDAIEDSDDDDDPDDYASVRVGTPISFPVDVHWKANHAPVFIGDSKQVSKLKHLLASD